jgi:26S proteasome non-ATPase regulatory subunit 5
MSKPVNNFQLRWNFCNPVYKQLGVMIHRLLVKPVKCLCLLHANAVLQVCWCLLQSLKKCVLSAVVVRYRIYDILITYCCASQENMTFCEEKELISSLLSEVSTGDILVQLNALELITTLSSCQHGRDYLERQGIIQKLAGNLDEATANPLASLLVPGLMKFFGALAHFQPDVLARYPNFTNTMFNLIDDPDVSMRMITIETLSFIATERDGKFALNQQGMKLDVYHSLI